MRWLRRVASLCLPLLRVSSEEIAYIQYSHVPRDGLRHGVRTDRLPPRRDVVSFAETFRIMSKKGYKGHLSYEGPNPAAWARIPRRLPGRRSFATRQFLPVADVERAELRGMRQFRRA